MRTCETCKYWKRISLLTGWCESGDLCEPGEADATKTNQLVYSYDEGGGFKTGKDFGCVHWQPATPGDDHGR